MAYTMEEFVRDYMKEHLPKLTPQEQGEVLEGLPAEVRLAGLPPEARLAGLPPEQIRRYLDQTAAGRKTRARTPRRKT